MFTVYSQLVATGEIIQYCRNVAFKFLAIDMHGEKESSIEISVH